MGDARAVAGRDPGAFFAGLREWVAAQGVPVSRHAYGPHPDQHGDLRLPDGEGPHPLAVVLHGGFWRAHFTSENTAAVAVALAQAGWASWNVEYRRVGTSGGFEDTLEDVAAACAAPAALDPRVDGRTCMAVGHSAGGQLALWLAGEGLVTGAAALAGVCDLAAAAAAGLGDDAVPGFLGGTPSGRPEAYRRADPLGRVPTGRRQLVVHGDRDDRVPPGYSERYCAAARAAGDDCRLLVLEGVDHFDPIDPRTEAWPRVVAALEALT